MRKIVFANQKGGCAKTTSVINLAAALGELGRKVLIIDLDPQANSTFWVDVESNSDCSSELFRENFDINSIIYQTAMENVSIVPATQKLSEIKTTSKNTKIDFFYIHKNVRKLKKIWDFVLIDTPPTLGYLTVNALVSAEELLVPVTTHLLSLAGVYQLMQKVNEIQRTANKDLKILGYLASRFDTRTRHSKEVLNSLKENFGNKVFKTIIRENVRLAEAPSFHESILSYASNSIAASDYRALAKEIDLN
ncbi:MAG: ParA family protein [Nitrosomonadales bacterium]|jgi:chromosome partitioning protein|nr:ParA family protein [Nitrosomonadales bacterium]MBT3918492.1 ParA family protein [Nitrosomonadales bacterium]MBT4182612.1 ParA family protein [Nitrosomonadales bacterium]MBT4570902.1 ParA family protein [Nitrosomonadales bacterium]MBT4759795.1 ParA family protein [Nitrosomonadales bacterium]|tara:strand:+ start:953 stop:1702 length:750 start_codon:yes stop_codon:yes gene_type:complete